MYQKFIKHFYPPNLKNLFKILKNINPVLLKKIIQNFIKKFIRILLLIYPNSIFHLYYFAPFHYTSNIPNSNYIIKDM